MASSLGSSFFAQWAGCQKLHVIPLAIDSHCASDSGAENFGPFTRFLVKSGSRKRPTFSRAPSARAFGAGLRPRPSATISYHLCNFWHPGSGGV